MRRAAAAVKGAATSWRHPARRRRRPPNDGAGASDRAARILNCNDRGERKSGRVERGAKGNRRARHRRRTRRKVARISADRARRDSSASRLKGAGFGARPPGERGEQRPRGADASASAAIPRGVTASPRRRLAADDTERHADRAAMRWRARGPQITSVSFWLTAAEIATPGLRDPAESQPAPFHVAPDRVSAFASDAPAPFERLPQSNASAAEQPPPIGRGCAKSLRSPQVSNLRSQLPPCPPSASRARFTPAGPTAFSHRFETARDKVSGSAIEIGSPGALPRAPSLSVLATASRTGINASQRTP